MSGAAFPVMGVLMGFADFAEFRASGHYKMCALRM
jgi:hypothetical protein